MSDAITELVQNAIGYGVLMALEDREGLLRRLQALPPNGTLADALRSDAEGFVRTRADLIDAVRNHFQVGPADEYRGQ